MRFTIIMVRRAPRFKVACYLCLPLRSRQMRSITIVMRISRITFLCIYSNHHKWILVVWQQMICWI
jgi:hypothetical protein